MSNPVQKANLSWKATRAGLWIVGLHGLTKLVGIAGSIVYARVLAPEHFGLIGIAMIFLSALDCFSKFGMDLAIIQKKRSNRALLDTAWSLQFLRGFFLFVIVFSGAPLAGQFFNSPQSIQIVRVLSVSCLITGAKNIGAVLFRKQLDFKYEFLLKGLPLLLGFGVGVSLTFALRNVWALVFANLAILLSETALSYFLHPFRPRFKISRDQCGHLFSFGKWACIGSVIFFLNTKADNLIVGKLLGTAALGLYAYTFNIVEQLVTKTGKITSTVAFPAFSSIQDDVQRLRSGWMKTFHVTAFFTLLISTGLYNLAGEFVEIVIGEKWMSIVPLIKIIAISSSIMVLTASTLFISIGKIKLAVYLTGIRVVVMFLAMYPLFRLFGINGIALAVLCGVAVRSIFWLYFESKYLQREKQEFVFDFVSVAFPCIMTSVSVHIIKANIHNIDLKFFIFLITVTITTYIFVSWFQWFILKKGAFGIVLKLTNEILQNFRK